MKNKCTFLVAAIALITSPLIHASEMGPRSYPTCNDQSEVFPCLESAVDSRVDFVNMMIENFAGIKMVHKGGKAGLHAESEFGTVTQVSSAAISSERHSPMVTVTKFEMKLSDHGGGDIDYPHQKWTVIQTTTAYGYYSESKYENSLVSIP